MAVTARQGSRVVHQWGFAFGNVLMAGGAPVLVSGVVPLVTGDGDGLFSITVGAAAIIAGLLVVALSWRVREADALPAPRRPAGRATGQRLPINPAYPGHTSNANNSNANNGVNAGFAPRYASNAPSRGYPGTVPSQRRVHPNGGAYSPGPGAAAEATPNGPRLTGTLQHPPV